MINQDPFKSPLLHAIQCGGRERKTYLDAFL